ncbi:MULTISPECIES: dihydroneopterin aldolase [Lactobacillales]|uniref:7,8-dihydroneopterin aldolase n=1 Tax=Enterococcus faecium TaxID=1352 RepID=A0A2G0E7Z3_ENTFC|nr:MULTISPECIES: dihydroneopterin aldolase [Lactobacillales]MBU6001321.1 dihydroneopterin aldolase [Lactococcus lactis]ELA71510.1 dihydroneopterin aldolase [Enterococcus faecium EnGen0017]KFO17873.1 dienelactone hydrolase [Enterococcus faecium UC7267]KGK75886.1 dienelactone hydrolase [Enterococcus faecium]MBA5812370.1 dihydroneopterin aldolase [Enterococcus faecium]
MYTIRIKNMAFHSHIGVLKEEKKVGQTIEIDIDVAVDAIPKDDALSTTVSYGDFYPTIKQIVDRSRVDLIETLAQEVILAIKNIDDRIQTVTVRIRKLNLPVDGVFDHVEIEMKQ